MHAHLPLAAGPRHVYEVVCRGPDGAEKWRDVVENLVVNEGLDLYLDALTAAAETLAVGLTDGTPTIAAGDTMGSHTGWAEVTAYDEAARPTPTFAAASSQSRDNSGSTATFTISTNGTTIGGAFVSTDASKGGTGGTLLGAGAFSAGDKTADDGDTLDVTVTLTQAAA